MSIFRVLPIGTKPSKTSNFILLNVKGRCKIDEKSSLSWTNVKNQDFSLVLKRCNNFPVRVMRKLRDFLALWNVLETKKESVHSRNSLGDHTLSFCINGETSVGILQQPPYAQSSKMIFPIKYHRKLSHFSIRHNKTSVEV